MGLWEYSAPGDFEASRDELTSVVDTVRANGAEQVVLIGGSRGGCLSLIAATELEPPVAGVAVLSCAAVWNRQRPEPLDPYLPDVAVPVLELLAADDRDVPFDELEADLARLGTTDIETHIIEDSSDHGAELLDDPAVVDTLTAFVARVTNAAPADATVTSSPSPTTAA